MEIIKILNATLAFSLEMIMCVAYGMWSYSLSPQIVIRWLLTLAVPGVVIVIWSLFAAPKAAYLLSNPAHYILELGLTLLAAFLLFHLGHHQWGIIIAVLAVVCQTAALFVGSI
jgi:hypothetical protein